MGNLQAEQRTTNVLALKQQHDELWRIVYERPKLSRVINPDADLKRKPVTLQEELLVVLLVAHLATARQASARANLELSDSLRQDVRWLFSLPVPNAVWQKIKTRHAAEFVAFINACCAAPGAGTSQPIRNANIMM